MSLEAPVVGEMPKVGEVLPKAKRIYNPQGSRMGTVAGEVCFGRDIGKVGPNARYVWVPCVDCGKPRWVILKHIKATNGGTPQSQRCHSCVCLKRLRDKTSWNWKGGRGIDSRGYVIVYITSESPYFPMASTRRHAYNRGVGYILEHRLLMAEHLGRCLTREEVVHHKNGIKDDNRLENLELILSAGKHNGHVTCPYCRREFGLA